MTAPVNRYWLRGTGELSETTEEIQDSVSEDSLDLSDISVDSVHSDSSDINKGSWQVTFSHQGFVETVEPEQKSGSDTMKIMLTLPS